MCPDLEIISKLRRASLSILLVAFVSPGGSTSHLVESRKPADRRRNVPISVAPRTPRCFVPGATGSQRGTDSPCFFRCGEFRETLEKAKLRPPLLSRGQEIFRKTRIVLRGGLSVRLLRYVRSNGAAVSFPAKFAPAERSGSDLASRNVYFCIIHHVIHPRNSPETIIRVASYRVTIHLTLRILITSSLLFRLFVKSERRALRSVGTNVNSQPPIAVANTRRLR